MFVRLLTALSLGLALAGPAPAADPKPKADPTETLLEKLFDAEVQIDEGANVNDIPTFEILQLLSKKYGVTFSVNDEAFKAEGVADARDRKPNVGLTTTRGLTLHQFLSAALDSMNATYLVKGGRVEVVPIGYAAKAAKAAVTETEAGKSLNDPLVCAVIKEKPLNEAVALLAERYDLTVVVSPQAGDAKTGFVTARLLNVPADRALDLLATQNDLRLVRKGNTFLITSKDHANELFAERLEKERQKIDLDKLREAPPPKPQPEPKP